MPSLIKKSWTVSYFSVPNLVAQTEKELVAWRPICYHAFQGNLLRLESYKRERNTIKPRIRENAGYFELE